MKDFPFIKITIAFIIGIISFPLFQLNFVYISFLILIVIYLSLKFFWPKYNSYYSSILLVGITLLLGIAAAKLGEQKISSPLIDFQKEKNSKLYAEVYDIELERSFEIVFTVNVDSIFINDKKFISNDKLICKFRGDSLQRSNMYLNLNAGNKIYLTGTYQKGREQRNPGEFDYDKYLKSKGITGLFVSYETDSIKILSQQKNYFKSVLHSLRKKIDITIHHLHNAQTAGLLRGLLLADRSEIDIETKNEFINSGVVHVLAVSGLHVGYILIIFIFIFGRFGIYTRSILTIIGLLLFMFITGVPPSVFRATLMSIILIIAFLSNRSTNIINSISIAAFIILLINPNEIYNPGFQLSFSAVLAIGILYPYFQKKIYALYLKHKFVEYILLFIGVSLSAQIGTLPFTLSYFSKLSLISILANLIVIPLIGFIISIAFITIFVAMISYNIAIYFAVANNLIVEWMIKFINLAGNLEFSFLWVRNYSIYDSIIFYLGLSVIMLCLYKIRKSFLKISLALILILSIFIYSKFDDKSLLEKNKLNIFMIDVGQGDSFVIKFPNGKTAIIDAGEANPFLDNGEHVITPLLDYLGIEKIDYGFISHLDLDHYGGFISLIHNDKIKTIYRPLPDSTSKSKRLEKFLAEQKVKLNFYNKSSIEVGNTKLYFLNDPYNYNYKNFSSNDKSGVIKIVYGKTSILFTGDCEYPAEYFLASNFGTILDSDVLKVGHHGSMTGSSEAFLKLVSPKISLISAGIKNKFNHPAESVINSLKKINSDVYRTDESGAVLLRSDGNEIKKINWK